MFRFFMSATGSSNVCDFLLHEARRIQSIKKIFFNIGILFCNVYDNSMLTFLVKKNNISKGEYKSDSIWVFVRMWFYVGLFVASTTFHEACTSS